MCVRTKLANSKIRIQVNGLVDQDYLRVRLLAKKWQHLPTEDWDFRLKALELFSAEGQSQRGLFNLATLNLRGIKK
jgi:hypothetical protein